MVFAIPISHPIPLSLSLCHITFSCIMWCSMNNIIVSSLLVLLHAAACNSQGAYIRSRATYYGSPDCLGTPSGACGYGEFGRKLNGGDVGAAGRLYANGNGCGRCYQVRCINSPDRCTEDGVQVVVTDHGYGDNTDFILSTSAFLKLARPNKGVDLLARGVVDVEYRRVPCRYPGKNLMVKVHEHSKFPDYLAIVVLYQSSMKDILAVDVWEESYQEWRGMRRAYGAVWDMANPPRGALSLRFQASGEGEVKWVQVGNVIPSDWQAGAAYDASIQL